MQLVVSTTAPSGIFHRAGRAWTREGTVLDEGDLPAATWAILRAEPLIHIAPAPGDQDRAATVAETARAAIRKAIAALEPGDFGQDGVPLLDAVRRRLAEPVPGLGRKLVAEVWAELKDEAGPA
ncbi:MULTISPECIES: hypothetical protein [unclassified Paracoccus (in: a-proteobacteria)]|uniref:hypothetical protein n=1 Tax=unclassified Paracoccus (in: a-proteobacteria) TaxID=2688777 RepID=UPI0012B41751|nr:MULTISPECIES: hypothetical protein [unclassified Paracoccus (in: a-proteobacteria)]UXU74356.1 hypothetical protein GB879_010650 [Paracoccus sp. SMMA_5]UXU80246.1 hypothetical protein GB880_010625 [Paracoccus sp. SMMA_5_TC]